ncbi:MAG: hypothetical protein CO186_04985 [Zetaproteobacteria bacterium CG_4_9_14_3_um_filter_49_83]|nr:MAG: hypothetical protein COW62_09870 [Zetaproteobacteria bacterium CG17_big_fil_post_rev_8_21_14_2_50_50_13]PIV31581.1 MAG: hypothetical protein COS35_00665 [Zetaproteobacteria bacterium CG02_land_8_20_14_3_00_50_9]PIY54566.1 MAG: hypothetical protein COZ00_13495 [Zetaproteobacteria bacterium CG_4_10_14_0_8_um_filter_49_80]PJA35705.1 MAG: hypothetical protein CO186_04985 [Zetaproteobacteria bacterium CG_4_9_14_3_um_filter_49_83]
MLNGGSFQADIGTDQKAGQPLFHGYGDDYLQLGKSRYTSGLRIHQKEIISPWGPERLRQLTEEHMDFLYQDKPELLVIGTGRLTAFPPQNILDMITDLHIGFECMDSRVAARTYNFLVAEGRTVSAVFLSPCAKN